MAYEPMFDFLKSRRKDAPQEVQDIETKSNERSLLAGATPLLVGLLTGNTGSGVEIASKALLQEDERANKERTSLLDHLRKTELAEKKAKQTGDDDGLGKGVVSVWDTQDQRLRIVPRSEAITDRYKPASFATEAQGQLAKTKSDIQKEKEIAVGKEFGRGNIVGKNPLTGNAVITSLATGESKPVGGKTGSSITPAFKSVRDKRYTQLQSRVKDDLDAIRTVNRGLTLSKSNMTMPEAVSLNMAVKITEDRGTDEDRAFVTNAVGKIAQLRELAEQEKNKKLARRKIKEANALFEMIAEVARKSVKGNVERSAKAISSTKEQEEDAKKFFGDLIPEESKRKVPKSGDDLSQLSDDDLDARINELMRKKGSK